MKRSEHHSRLKTLIKIMEESVQVFNADLGSSEIIQWLCQSLHGSGLYPRVWAVSWAGKGDAPKVFEEGWGKAFSPKRRQLSARRFTKAERDLIPGKAVFTRTPGATCADCPLSGSYGELGSIKVGFSHRHYSYGLLSMTVEPNLISESEVMLLAKLSRGVAFAICIRELEKTCQRLRSLVEIKDAAVSEVIGQFRRMERMVQRRVRADIDRRLLPIWQKLKLRIPEDSKKHVEYLDQILYDLLSGKARKKLTRPAALTSRENEICDMIGDGLSSKEIATMLGIAPGTVDRHRNTIRRKLGLTSASISLQAHLLSSRRA